MAPGALDTEIDESDRAPDEIGVRQVEFLVDGGAARGLQVEAVGIGMIHAEFDRPAHIGRPPMLVADAGAEGGDGRTGYSRDIEPAGGREGRPAVGSDEG